MKSEGGRMKRIGLPAWLVAMVLTAALCAAPPATTQGTTEIVEGTVTTFDGKPVADAEVGFVKPLHSRKGVFRLEGVETLSKARTDAQGVFRINAVISGDPAPHFIAVTAPGFGWGVNDYRRN